MKKSKILASLTLASIMALTNLSSSFANEYVTKISGSNKVETSMKTILDVPTSVDTLVIASAKSFADSLSSVNIVNKDPNSRLILIENNTDISDFLERVKPLKALIIGGPDTLKGKFEKNLKDFGTPYQRIYGVSRYETNKKTLDSYNNVALADGRNYPDALSASAFLREMKMGLMLINGSKNISTNKSISYTFGGSDSVKYPKGVVLAGRDRYETNEKINNCILSRTDNVIVHGNSYTDALSATNLIGDKGKVMLLNGSKISKFNQEQIKNGTNIVVGSALDSIYDKINTINIGQIVEDFESKNYSPSSGAITTQRELDNYIINRFLNGIDEDGEYVVVNGPTQISNGLKYILQDVGFMLETQYKDGKFYYEVQHDWERGFFYGQKYDKATFVRNIERIRNDIRKSGALYKKNRKDKFETFSKYTKRTYSYYASNEGSIYHSSSSPYTLTLNRTASCQGYSHNQGLACMIMKIPCIMVTGTDKYSGGYHAENEYLNESGRWIRRNTTGYYESDRLQLLNSELDLSQSIYDSYMMTGTGIKNRDYLDNRHSAITNNFYN